VNRNGCEGKNILPDGPPRWGTTFGGPSWISTSSKQQKARGKALKGDGKGKAICVGEKCKRGTHLGIQSSKLDQTTKRGVGTAKHKTF